MAVRCAAPIACVLANAVSPLSSARRKIHAAGRQRHLGCTSPSGMARGVSSTRRVFLCTAAAVALGARPGLARAAAVSPAAVSVVEDWRAQALGRRGIPEGWEPYPTPGSRPEYDFTVVETAAGERALQLKSHGDRSTIARPVTIDLVAHPILEWRWKAVQLPRGGDIRRRATSDLTAHVLIVWPRAPRLLRSRLLAYAWDATAPAGTIAPSQKTPTVTFIVVRSGLTGLGQWLTERRDVQADYRTVFGEAPDPVGVVALSIDTNDTRTHAEALVGPLVFRALAGGS